MDWFIKRVIACPKTGTGFALASSMNNLSLILWYRGDYFLHTENTLSTSPFGLIVNGKRRNIEIIHAFPYSPSLWYSFRSKNDCPGNDEPFIRECQERQSCLFKTCPYGTNIL